MLHVTVLGDKCNRFIGALRVARECRADRDTEEYTEVCHAEVLIVSTKKGCSEIAPVTVKMDLDANKVTPEARKLVLRYAGEEIEVDIPQN